MFEYAKRFFLLQNDFCKGKTLMCGDIQELCCVELLCMFIKKTTLEVFKSNFIYCAMATFIVPVRFR